MLAGYKTKFEMFHKIWTKNNQVSTLQEKSASAEKCRAQKPFNKATNPVSDALIPVPSC